MENKSGDLLCKAIQNNVDRNVIIDDIRVRGIGKSESIRSIEILSKSDKPEVKNKSIHKVYFENGWMETPVYLLEDFGYGSIINGPAIILNGNSTLVIEPNCIGEITKLGDIIVNIQSIKEKIETSIDVDNTLLAVFSHRFMSIAEQMGRTLQRTSISTNIKERLDFSCALFSPD